MVSNNRQNTAGTTPETTTPPNTPGPDDDYRLYFPQTNATWSDIALDSQGRLFAALGSGPTSPTTSLYTVVNRAAGNGGPYYIDLNGVYLCLNPQTTITPLWYSGSGLVDSQASTNFLHHTSLVANGLPAVRNGNIKVAAVGDAFDGAGTVYASISDQNGPSRMSSRLRGLLTLLMTPQTFSSTSAE